MDVTTVIAAQNSKYKPVTVEKDIALEVDAGYLTVTDPNPIDPEAYKNDLETHLLDTARDGVQVLLNTLFSLPTQPSPDGPLAQLPTPTTALPRAKPLPKPKPPTKWEQFAAARGISKRKREKAVWDEEKGEWINRWGRDGKSRESEEQWLQEVPDNAPIDFDPGQQSRKERKERVAKNEKQQLRNIANAQSADQREAQKAELNRSIATSRVSTASMGRFDKKLAGEPKLRGVKRKFEPNELSGEAERKASMSIIASLERGGAAKKALKDGNKSDVLNVRKAVRFASGGRGGAALGRELNGSEKSTKKRRK
jgi:regulator of ribosome biosynthesis